MISRRTADDLEPLHLLVEVVARDADDLYRIVGTMLGIEGVKRTSTALVMRSMAPPRGGAARRRPAAPPGRAGVGQRSPRPRSACSPACRMMEKIDPSSRPFLSVAAVLSMENTACVSSRTSDSDRSGRSGITTETHSSA